MANGKKKQTELAKAQDAPLAVPSYITEGAQGFEHQQAGDLVFPRAILMQGLSPRVADKAAEAGEIYNSVTEELIAAISQKRAIVPVMFWHEWIEWSARIEGGGMVARSQDPEGALAKRCKGGETSINEQGREVPSITEYMVFLVQPVDVENPLDASQMFCICCARTNYKHGRKLLTLARMRGNKPLFAGVYNFYAVEERNKVGQRYYVFNFTNAGWAPEAVFENLKLEHARLKDTVVSAAAPVHEEEGSTVESETEI